MSVAIHLRRIRHPASGLCLLFSAFSREPVVTNYLTLVQTNLVPVFFTNLVPVPVTNLVGKIEAEAG